MKTEIKPVLLANYEHLDEKKESLYVKDNTYDVPSEAAVQKRTKNMKGDL